MRVSHAPVYRRRRFVAAACAVAVVGMGLGMLTAELWSVRFGSRVEAAPAASVTPGSATPASSPVPSDAPTSSATPVVTASPAPVASPVLSFDANAHSVDDPDSIWVVVNKARPMVPEDYEPADLETVDGASGTRLRAEAAAALAGLRDAARAADADFAMSTGFRDRDLQSSLYTTYVERSGQVRADRYSARPGFSEHQTGLSVDVHAGGCDLQSCFAVTPAGRFLAEHAWEHGFIVRYPEGKEDVTGYIFEPWHLRYVGTELAAEMRARGVTTLEEFFGLDPAPDYS